jgi:hypothetical protein
LYSTLLGTGHLGRTLPDFGRLRIGKNHSKLNYRFDVV